MAWNGSGTFSRTNGVNSGATTWDADKTAGTLIRSDRHDTHDQDLATGINACITKNNESKPTAHFLPNADASYNLGSGSAQWASLYLSGTLYGDITLPGALTLSGANTYSAIQKWAKGSDVASGSALSLGTDGNYFDITGTTTITSIDTIGVGTVVKLHFDSALTLTHHATDLVLPGGANITTAAGDEAEFVEYATGDWRCTNYTKASGEAVREVVNSYGSQATTSGSTVDFTSIPSWVKRITVIFNSVSLSGTDELLVQIGDSGGVESTGYVSASSAGGVAASATDGFVIRVADASKSVTGHMVLTLISGSAWIASHAVAVGAGSQGVGGGSKTLSATLDRVRITRSGAGSDVFDNGSVNIFYE